MAGTWMGTANFSGAVDGPEQVEFTITVHGNSAQFTGVCIAGGGMVTAVGAGNSASWTAQSRALRLSSTLAPLTAHRRGTTHRSLSDGTLITTAAGSYETETAGCNYFGSVTVSIFAQKAP